ncbi:MAG TPA: TauD/TfdA family dioxygenase [Gemmataceae bacterium]|nr:TauD/TfdA family dioxygenase [Gemmataceae bacterium]
MLTQSIHDARAWTADTIDDPVHWYYPLPPACLEALKQLMEDRCRLPCTVTEVTLADAIIRAGRKHLQPVLQAFESGRGFAVIDQVSIDRYSVPEAKLLYWLLGQILGIPFEQNVQGTLLYDVRDTGQDVAYGARFSVTNAESTFHTDNSFGSSILDYVGLLCLATAKSGGRSQVASAYGVHNDLLAHYPEELHTLYKPFHFDRRGGVLEGQAPTVEYPVFHWDGRDLTVRYLRYWIDTGHQKASRPLTAAQNRALDALDNVIAKPEMRVEFDLQPGQMFFINNRWILHNRTAFEDHPDLDRRRHYVRLWLKAKQAPS